MIVVEYWRLVNGSPIPESDWFCLRFEVGCGESRCVVKYRFNNVEGRLSILSSYRKVLTMMLC